MDTLAFVTAELETKQTSLDRLRRLLFGATTETTRTILGRGATPGAPGPEARPRAEAGLSSAGPARPGHGRTGAAAYTGADTVTIAHPSLRRGDRCPGCPTGKIYPLAEPATLVRITGMAPLGATVYACERWRCNLCGEVFTAPAPEGVGAAKYDATATTMVGLLKYGCGLPFHRIETLQRGMGIPLPAATQWELVRDALPQLVPAWDELLRQAAQGEVVYNDDTTMKILALSAEQRRAAAADEATDARTGVFTSGIVATRDGHHVALFFTGRQHAGENLADVLAQRAAALMNALPDPPIRAPPPRRHLFADSARFAVKPPDSCTDRRKKQPDERDICPCNHRHERHKHKAQPELFTVSYSSSILLYRSAAIQKPFF